MAPELLRVNAREITAKAKLLFGPLAVVFYILFLVRALAHGHNSVGMPFVIFVIFLTTGLLIILHNIFGKRKSYLIFTSIGIADTKRFAVKYDQLGAYKWEKCSVFLPPRDLQETSETTLFLTANKGTFPESAFVTRSGESILGRHRYFFDGNQILQAEKILDGFGIERL
jgi:hypothetical protein